MDKRAKKILNSFLLTCLSGVAAGLTAYSQGLGGKQSILVGVSTMVTFVTNTVRKYIQEEGLTDGTCSW